MGRSMMRRVTQTLQKYLQPVGYVRWSRMSVAIMFVISLFVPTFIQISEIKAYALSPEVKTVLGSANKNLSAKFSFDKTGNKWQFNKNGVAALANDIAKQQGDKDVEGVASALSQLAAKKVGGSGAKDTSLYSVDLPVKAEDGITYYDNVTRLSFKMIPTFSTRDAKLVDDRIVYPFSGAGKVVYTAKSNGLKEDIVLSEYIGDTLRYGYTLDLPETLEARLLDDGSIGVYSANPALFGNISFNDESDKERVMEGRKNGQKDHLVFGIPAPFIKDQKGQAGNTKYELDGNKLTVVASGLKGLNYPLAVDPSVTVTSTADFLTGNNEGMIDFGTSGQITRKAVTGGTVSTWNYTDNSVNRGTTQNGGSGAANGLITVRDTFDSVTHNGFMYVLGGDNTTGGYLTSIERAPINSDGTLGTWVASGDLPEARTRLTAVVYNGYIYIAGGITGGNDWSADVKYVQINTDGSLGTWGTTTALPVARGHHGMVAYNSKMYIINGCTNQPSSCNGASPTATVYCADINATGTLGTWNTCNTTNLTGRYGHGVAVYNGYIYMAGGCETNSFFSCNSLPATLQYTKINADGSLGNWLTTTTSFTTPRLGVKLVAKEGYLYLTGGHTTGYQNDIQYAPVYADGNVGTWGATASYDGARTHTSLVAYNNHLYIIAGCANFTANCGVFKNDVQFTTIDLAGAIQPYSTEADFDADSRDNAAMVASNGYLYILGGQLNGAGVGTNTGVYAAINADGSIGTWSATTTFADFRQGATAITYGNSLYLIGGGTNNTGTGNCTFVDSGVSRMCTKVERATINLSTGQLTWVDSFTYYTDNPRKNLTAVVNGGYFYVIGGIYNNNSNESTEVNFAAINSDGTLGTFAKTTAQLSTARGDGVGAVAWNGRIYVVGGRENPTAEYATPDPTSGQVTSWGSAGNALPDVGGQSTRAMSVSGSGGYIYVTGGINSALNITDATQIAKINADGTLGNWVTSPQLMTNNRYDHSSTAYNGTLYVAAGCTTTLCTGGGASKNYQYAKINNGGNGAVGTWSNAGSFTTARSQAAAATYDGYIYLTGGCSTATGIAGCTTSTNDTRYAPLAGGGSLTWSALNSNVPTNRYGHASVAYNGYLYAVGGCSSTGGTNGFCTSFLNDVQRIRLNADGNTTGNTWGSAGTTLGTGRYGLSATVYNGYMYVTGGCSATTSGNCSTTQQTVEYAQINADGSLGSWGSTGGSGFTTGRFLHSTVAYAGKLYVAGGCSAMSSANCTTLQNDIQHAVINTNGTVSSTWNSLGYFPTARYGASLTAQNGTMYLSGGCSVNSAGACTTFQTDVQKAFIGASGNVGRWEKVLGTAYTEPRYLHAGIIADGNLYLLGGTKSGGSLLADSMGTSLQLQSRIGRYSKLISISPTTDIASVHYNGSLDGGSSVQYKVAPVSGVFGTATQASQGTGSEPTPLCAAGTVYYIQVMVTIGDLSNAVLSDGNLSNVTDITIYHRLNATPPPNLRLNGGKWFSGETQQSLDICKQFGS